MEPAAGQRQARQELVLDFDGRARRCRCAGSRRRCSATPGRSSPAVAAKLISQPRRVEHAVGPTCWRHRTVTKPCATSSLFASIQVSCVRTSRWRVVGLGDAGRPRLVVAVERVTSAPSSSCRRGRRPSLKRGAKSFQFGTSFDFGVELLGHPTVGRLCAFHHRRVQRFPAQADVHGQALHRPRVLPEDARSRSSAARRTVDRRCSARSRWSGSINGTPGVGLRAAVDLLQVAVGLLAVRERAALVLHAGLDVVRPGDVRRRRLPVVAGRVLHRRSACRWSTVAQVAIM